MDSVTEVVTFDGAVVRRHIEREPEPLEWLFQPDWYDGPEYDD